MSKGIVTKWLKEISEAQKREKDFRKQGKRINKIYEADDTELTPYNILYSNTETLAPALYNSTPRPVVQRRYKDKDPLGAMVSKVTTRTLEFFLDSNQLDSPNFDTAMEKVVEEALVPGRGLMRFAYDATFKPAGVDGSQPRNSEDSDSDNTLQVVDRETVTWEDVPWNRYCHGYARSWTKIPWLAFEHLMDKEELEKNFGEEIAEACKLTLCKEEEATDEEEGASAAPPDSGEVEFAQVYEIWDKEHKKVLFISPGLPDQIIKEVEDPLKLSGFYPCPSPLILKTKINSLIPTPLYLMYEQQAEELNDITVRIKKITRAMKVRGFYDSTLQDIDKLMSSVDNTLLPAQNVAAMLQGQTLEKAIWLMPIEKLVAVLQQLYLNRQQVKAVIFDITGIADIMRGSSQASETLGAQEIKTQWGTLRLKRSQKMVQRFVRDSLRIMAEIATKKLASKVLSEITGIQLPTVEQKAQVQLQMQQAVMQAQQTGQPPQPPLPEVMEMMALPTWDDLKSIFLNDMKREYKIDIETNSTVDAEATEDKQAVSELLNGIAQFMSGVGPMIQSGIMPFGVAKEMMLSVVRRYRFGTELEDELSKMQAPPPPPPDPKIKGGELDNEAKMQGMQAKKQEQQMKAQLAQMQVKIAEIEAAAKIKEIETNQQLADMTNQLKVQELLRQDAYSNVKHQVKLTDLQRKAVQSAEAAKQKETPNASI